MVNMMQLLLNNKEVIFWDQSHNNCPKKLFQKQT